mgnify:CR=1 FL=1
MRSALKFVPVILVIVAFFVAGSPAHAEPGLVRGLGIEAYGGFATPLGLGGLSIDVAPLPRLVLAIGGGLDVPMNAHGAQVAAMSRFHLYERRTLKGGAWAFAAGLGAAIGRREVDHVGAYQRGHAYLLKRWERGVRATAELSLEHTWRSGIRLRGFAGVALTINEDEFDCFYVGETYERICKSAERDSVGDAGAIGPFLGDAIGYDYMAKRRLSVATK